MLRQRIKPPRERKTISKKYINFANHFLYIYVLRNIHNPPTLEYKED